jgi:nucleoid-associated protein YgaU
MSGFSDLIAGSTEQTILKKLTIIGFEDPEQDKQIGEFEAFYNPATFQVGYALKYSEAANAGAIKKEMRYNGYEATTYSFDLQLDGTGGSRPTTGAYSAGTVPTPVSRMVRRFLKVVYGFSGTIHRSCYLKLVWGDTTIAKCVLNSANITYDLFDPSGNPLRAKIACSFKEYSYEELIRAEARLGSPDMTHIRVVQQGDRLPLMCEQIYGDAKLYLEVARYNNLNNYRNLSPGQKIYFPPLVPTKS